MRQRIVLPVERQNNCAVRMECGEAAAQPTGRSHDLLVWLALFALLVMLLPPQVARAQSALDGFNPGANNGVRDLAVQDDGKIVVGGLFTQLGGPARNHIGRLNPDGTLDASFNPAANDTVNAAAVQSDGKIVVGGIFTQLGGQTRNTIARLNSDGTLDASFDPGTNGLAIGVRALAVQSDGKIVVGGSFTQLGGQPRNNIGRLNADGTLDASFNPGASSNVYAIAIQAKGRIVVGGAFMQLRGQPRSRIGRLNSDGTLDTTFNSGTEPPG